MREIEVVKKCDGAIRKKNRNGKRHAAERKSFVLSAINLLVSVNRSCIHVLAVSFNGGTSVQRGILNELPYTLEVVHSCLESLRNARRCTRTSRIVRFYSTFTTLNAIFNLDNGYRYRIVNFLRAWRRICERQLERKVLTLVLNIIFDFDTAAICWIGGNFNTGAICKR